jgi:ribose 5-phosphate isomerase B
MGRRYASTATADVTEAADATVEPMRVALATDHAGFPLKAPIADWLQAAGHQVVDFGVESTEPVDYPDVIAPAARSVASGECDLGVVLGGSGTGEQIVANKIRGIRCVEAADPVTARLGREHNDANMLAMGARIIGQEVALACVAAFMEASFQGGRHARRVGKIRQLEEEQPG